MEDEIFHGNIVDETDLAIAFKPLEEYLSTIWLPKSQVAVKSRGGTAPGSAVVEIPIWLARQKGICR